jgi:ABC-type transport system substrate-binding protein
MTLGSGGVKITWRIYAPNPRRTKDLEARKKLIFDIQRYAAEQQYYVYTNVNMITASWQPYVKNYAPNPSFDYGGRAAALWLDR